MHTDANHVSVRNLTEAEAREVYSGMPKEKLIDMLIQCNKIIDDFYNRGNGAVTDIPRRNSFGEYYDCSDWAHCSNPYHDCINCPLMFSGTGTWTSLSTTISISDIDYGHEQHC